MGVKNAQVAHREHLEVCIFRGLLRKFPFSYSLRARLPNAMSLNYTKV